MGCARSGLRQGLKARYGCFAGVVYRAEAPPGFGRQLRVAQSSRSLLAMQLPMPDVLLLLQSGSARRGHAHRCRREQGATGTCERHVHGDTGTHQQRFSYAELYITCCSRLWPLAKRAQQGDSRDNLQHTATHSALVCKLGNQLGIWKALWNSFT